MKVYSKDGLEMMDIKSITRDGDTMILKGKIMGAMSTVIVIRPQDCWAAVQLLGISLICHLPAILIKGFFRSRRKTAD